MSAKNNIPHGLSQQAQDVIAINLAAVIFGTAALYGKLHVSPFWIVAMRAGFASTALGPLGGYRAGRRLTKSDWIILAFSGVLLAIHWLAFFASVQMAGVAVATLTFATFPLFTVLLEAVQQRRLPRPAEIAVGIVIVIAVALLAKPDGGAGNLLGSTVGLASAVSYALFWRVAQGLRAVLPPLAISFYQNLAVLAFLFPALFFAVPAPVLPAQWLSLAALGVINTAVMLQLYLFALKHISASTCSGFVALEPVYAVIFAALLFDEPLTPWVIVSLVLILGASLILLKIERQALPAGIDA